MTKESTRYHHICTFSVHVEPKIASDLKLKKEYRLFVSLAFKARIRPETFLEPGP